MKKKRDIITVGFALFAMFFGAGNLIFPPYLGMASGDDWFLGFICYIIADAGLAMVTMLAVVKNGGTLEGITGRVGKTGSMAIGVAVAMCIGPMLAIPRTAATAFEMGAQPFGFKYLIVYSAVYFTVAFLLCIKSSRVIDIIGNILTPMLLVGLVIMIIKGMADPIGEISTVPMVSHIAKHGILAGYQTLDAFAALLFSILIISSANQKGYEGREKMGFIAWSCVVAGTGLFVIYGGLTYLGAMTSQYHGMEIGRAALLLDITYKLLGSAGVAVLGLIVTLACMTTVIGLVSAISEYFYEISGERLKYEVCVTAICIMGFVVSCLGLSAIVNIAVPILNILYPVVLTLVFLSLFGHRIKNDNIIKGAVLAALAVAVLSVTESLGMPFSFITKLPLSSMEMQWILPAAAGGIVGAFFRPKPIGSQGGSAEG